MATKHTGRACDLLRLLLGLLIAASTAAFAFGHRAPLPTTPASSSSSPLCCGHPLRLRPGAPCPVTGLPLSRSALLLQHHGAATTCTAALAPRAGRGRAIPVAALLRRRGGAKVDGLTLLSTAMGYVIIAGSMLFKVPQAVRIFRKKSAEGLSASMYILETAGIAMSLAFSMKNAFPFSTYGEAVFILLQNVAIMAGISTYSDTPKPSVLALWLLLCGGAFAYVVSPGAPMLLVNVLQSVSIPLLNLSRVPQLMLNYKNKSTGELAPSTLILQAAGNLARIFTTLVQVQNNLFLLSCVVAMVFNGALVAQYFMYRGNAPKPAAA